MQRTSSDLRLNPHLHVVFLDGAYHETGATLAWQELGHLKTREVGRVLERAVRRIMRSRRHGAIETDEGDSDEVDPEEKLAASAVSGHAPPAGPQWLRGLVPLSPSPLTFDKPLCASLDGYKLHAATRAGALLDTAGREALLRYVLRPPLAQERLEPRPDGVVRIAGRAPKPHAKAAPAPEDADTPKRAGAYRPWAELLERTFGVDVLQCPKCQGRMKVVAMVTEPRSVERYLAGIGELDRVPRRSPRRGPPYWKSVVLRRRALGAAA